MRTEMWGSSINIWINLYNVGIYVSRYALPLSVINALPRVLFCQAKTSAWIGLSDFGMKPNTQLLHNYVVVLLAGNYELLMSRAICHLCLRFVAPLVNYCRPTHQKHVANHYRQAYSIVRSTKLHNTQALLANISRSLALGSENNAYRRILNCVLPFLCFFYSILSFSSAFSLLSLQNLSIRILNGWFWCHTSMFFFLIVANYVCISSWSLICP